MAVCTPVENNQCLIYKLVPMPGPLEEQDNFPINENFKREGSFQKADLKDFGVKRSKIS